MGALMFQKKARKFLTDTYRVLYIGFGIQGIFRLFGFWGSMTWFAIGLLGIVVIFFGGLHAVFRSRNLRWVNTTDSLVEWYFDLAGAAGLFYGAWVRLHWHWGVAALSATFALAVLQWLKSEQRTDDLATIAERVQAEACSRADEFLCGIGPDRVCEGKVTKVLGGGAVITFAPRIKGWLHISHIPGARQGHVSRVLRKGDSVKVTVFDTNDWGVLRLSMMGADPINVLTE